MVNDRLKPNDEASVVRDKQSADPALAAIVVVPDTYDTVRHTMSHLQAQTAVEQIEIIFVTPSYRELGLEESEVKCFHSWHVVEVGSVTSIARGYVAGIHHAHAPIVALTEDHSFPDANWAEVMIAAHQQSWAAVGPTMRNGNPGTMLSWADFYQAYGEWAHPISSGSVRHLPGHNSSYKRPILLAYGNQLEVLMRAEGILHRHLRAQGYELLREPRTCTSHLNFTSWSSWIPAQYHTGRQFASTWVHSRSWLWRLLFTVASPLIPWVRLYLIQKCVRRGRSRNFLIRLLPVLFVGLLANGFGQMVGYATGAGDSTEKVAEYEFHRVKHIEPTDQGA
ncbi:MAG: hypothetical protein ACTSPR_07940 [Candidatus Thorarchaeota archaeon]